MWVTMKANESNNWFSSFPITKITLFPLIKDQSCQKSDLNFPAMQCKMELFRGSRSVSSSLFEPKHVGRTGTINRWQLVRRLIYCHDLHKMWWEDELGSLFMKELRWNPVRVVSAFLPWLHTMLCTFWVSAVIFWTKIEWPSKPVVIDCFFSPQIFHPISTTFLIYVISFKKLSV